MIRCFYHKAETVTFFFVQQMLHLVLVVATASVSQYIVSNGRMRNCEGFERKRSYAYRCQSINSPIIPLRNIGRPQKSSTALYSSRRTCSLPKSFSFLWPLLAPFFATCSSVSLYPVYLGGSTLGLVWLYLPSVSAVYGPAILTCVS
jgi:hypothetical protein